MVKKNTKAKSTKANPPKAAKETTSRTLGDRTEEKERGRQIRADIMSVCLIGLGLFCIFALFFPASGKLGVALGYGLRGIFGDSCVVLPFFMIAYGVLSLLRKTSYTGLRSILLALLIFLCVGALWASQYVDMSAGPMAPLKGIGLDYIFKESAAGRAGGVACFYTALGIVKLIGKFGLIIFLVVLIICALMLFINTPISNYFSSLRDAKSRRKERIHDRQEHKEAEAIEAAIAKDIADIKIKEDPISKVDDDDIPHIVDGNSRSVINGDAPVSKKGSILQNMENFSTKKSDTTELSSENEMASADKYKDMTANQRKIMEMASEDERFGTRSTAVDDIIKKFNSLTGGRVIDTQANDIATDAATGLMPNPFDEAAGDMAIMEDFTNSGKNEDINAQATDISGSKKEIADYKLPPLSLLKKSTKKMGGNTASQLKEKSIILEQAMRDFRVGAKVLKVTVGPTVTRYEVEPDIGVKIGSIRNLEPDLALKLSVKSVRVVAMPSTSMVGIEAYNENASLVTLRDIIESEEFSEKNSSISFALGKNISGRPIVADLTDMPHLLIAGTTGSGKSVCINSILLSVLYRARPDEVKLILVDPKVVELKSYADIPHLLLPVVTEPERAASALAYAVSVMNDRYKKFADVGVRNITGYNQYLVKNGKEDDILPKIIIVIDELSDLMMVAPGKVQESISRLAAMARAAGMHLIVATQQPLASILTSVIKANIPSRIAFSVSSNSASRVILDDSGAERLLGNGDLLFSPVGTREPMRVQGAYVSDGEVAKITDYIKSQVIAEYDQQEVKTALSSEDLDMDGGDSPEDEFFDDALIMVVKAGNASISMIQRRFRIGYNRAARLVDLMEEMGIVGASDGTNKPRDVLWSESRLDEYLGEKGMRYEG